MMLTLQIKDNGLFLDDTGKPCTRLSAVKMTDQKTANQYLDMYYLIGINNSKHIQIVPYPKIDNEALQKEWTELKYSCAVSDGYADKVSSKFIMGY